MASLGVSSPALALCEIGDAVAARSVARGFWAAEAAPPTIDLLVLTAACLAASDAADAPTVDDLAAALDLFRDGAGLMALLSNPSQFIRYAAAELEAAGGRRRQDLLGSLKQRLRPAGKLVVP